MGIEPVFGSTTAALVGPVLSYSVNRRWVLDASAKISKTLARFVPVWMLTLLISAQVLVSLLALGFHHLVVRVTVTGVLVLINFNLHRRWTFSGTHVPPFDE